MRRLFDSIISHRIDLQRFSRREASIVLGIMGGQDAELVEMLRRRLPHLNGVDRRAAAELIGAMRKMRRAAFDSVHDKLRGDLVELGKVEGAAISKIARATVGVPIAFNPVRENAIKASLSQNVFSGGRGAKQTLGGWFDTLAAADQGRLSEAIQIGIRRQEHVDDMVRRIAGTREAGYADGLLSISRRGAETAVRTGVVHVANAAQREWNRANEDVVIGSRWTSVLDERTCDECRDLDGGFVPNGDREAPDGMEDLGDVAPPAHPNCRCTLVPELDLDALADRMPDELEEAA